MDYLARCVRSVLLWVMLVWSPVTTEYKRNIVEEQEFCQMETFNATCRENEVLLMHRARYGRMKLGRCVKKNLGYLGCAVDVLMTLDARCSGKQQCSITNPDPILYSTQPCPGDTTSYLEVSYECIRVSDEVGQTCRSGRPVKIAQPNGFLSSALTVQNNLGTAMCPWSIAARPGQRLNFTIYNFNRAGGSDDTLQTDELSWRRDVCYEYATLRETGVNKRITVCGGETRQTHLYLSRTHQVDIEVVNASILKSIGPFLLRYEAVGCPDLVAPKHGWVKRKGDTTEVRCNKTSEVWYLTCKGTDWFGKMGNCSTGGAVTGSMLANSRPFPFGILVVVAIGVALGVFLGGILLLLAIFYMKRRQRRRDSMVRVVGTVGGDHRSSVDSPQWDRLPKSIDSDQTLFRESHPHPGCVPYCDHGHLTTLPRDKHVIDVCINQTQPFVATDTVRSNPSRPHVYECPKFS